MPKSKKWNPFATGGMYDTHSGRWQLETDVAEMTLDVLDAGTYLRHFSKDEAVADYDYRTSMCVPLDMCRDGVRIRVDNLWRTAPTRDVKGPYKAIIDRLIDDADNEGSTLDAFMRRALWSYYVTGTDIVTQVTAGDGAPIETKADEQAADIRPYFMQLPPLLRYDWAVTGSGNFIWARYCLGDVPVTDERAGASNQTRFLTLTKDEWRHHIATRTKDAAGQEVVEVDTTAGSHDLGRPPIIKLYFAESAKSGQGAVPLSLLTRPAVVAKVAMNLKSQADADLLAAVTRWFATGVADEELPKQYGPNMLIKFASPESKIDVLQGDVGHITEKREWLNLYLGEILRLMKFRGGMAEISASSGSGLKLAIERTDLDNELRATAGQLEQAELEMMRQAVSLVTGKVIPPEKAAKELGYETHYNRDFVLEPLGEMLDNVKKFVADCGFVSDAAPSILREMLHQVANMLAREGTPAAIAMMEEINAADLTGTAEEGVATEQAEAPE